MSELFGTDGIRGVANVYPITPELVLRLGKAIAHYFRNKKGNGKTRIVIGKDTRLSGYMLESALTSGIWGHHTPNRVTPASTGFGGLPPSQQIRVQ